MKKHHRGATFIIHPSMSLYTMPFLLYSYILEGISLLSSVQQRLPIVASRNGQSDRSPSQSCQQDLSTGVKVTIQSTALVTRSRGKRFDGRQVHGSLNSMLCHRHWRSLWCLGLVVRPGGQTSNFTHFFVPPSITTKSANGFFDTN